MTDINSLLDQFADCHFQCGAMNVDETVKYREMVDRLVEIRKAIIELTTEKEEEEPESLDIPMFLRRQGE